MKIKNSTRRIARILLGGMVSVFMTGTMMIGSVYAGEGYGDAHGGVPGCESLVLATCFGAVWRWYSTTSNSVYISGTVNDSTCQPDGVAASGYITGCGEYGGYWRYAWVAQRNGGNAACNYSYPQYAQRGLVSIGTGDYISTYFGGVMKYAYGYNSNDGRWNEVKEIYEALRAQDPYTFSEGWGYGSRLSWFCGPSTVEEVVPPITYYTLTAKAVDRQGNYISVINDVSNQVEEGTWASVTKRNKTGYTFYGFKSGRYDTSYLTTSTSYGQTMWSDRTIYAVYEQQVFSGRARAYSGTTMSGTGVSTGFVKATKTENLTVECPNAGCDTVFDLALKTEKGEGVVNFVANRSQNGGGNSQQTPRQTVPFAPSTSGTTLELYRQSQYRNPYPERLLPGQSVCYNVVFSPDGGSNVTVKACASAKVSTFQGKVNVTTTDGNETINWTSSSKTVTKNITNCPVTGCKVSFNHNLKRTDGIGSTNYTVARTSNYSAKVSSNSNLKSGEETFAENPHKVWEDKDLILVPGQVVCETITFKANNNTVTVPNDTVLKLCASALGKAQPDDPTNPPTVLDEDTLSDAFIDMRVKNADGPDKYKGYQKTVYAKPGQNVTYRASYNPILQYTYNIIPQKMRVDSGSMKPSSGINTSSTLESLYNANRGSYSNWNNAITVHGSEGMSSYSKIHGYTIGDTSKQKEKNTHKVSIGDVGKDLAESATTNLRKNNTAAMTPSQVTFTSNGTNKDNLATIDTSSKTSIAHAYVPYNFDTKLEIKTDNADPIYAGEDKEIEYEIDVVPRKNPETSKDDDKGYATVVPDFLGRIVIYQPIHGEKPGTNAWGSGKTNDVCNYFGLTKATATCYYDNEESGPLNLNGNVDGAINERILKMSAPDLAAGTKICVAVATYPSNSGAYTNWSEKEGNKKWRISDSKCFLIAKRPSFQVWGGSLYAGGSIKTSAAIKTTLKDLPAFTGVMVFSSWVEQSVVAKGQVFALASGAATGLASNIAGGGSHEPSSDYCKYRVPLSLANYSTSMVAGICPNQVTGNSGIAAALTNRVSLIAPLANEDSLTNEYSGNTTITLNNSTPKNVIRYNVNGNVTIGTNSVLTGKTHIIKATGDVTITGNINYQVATYSSLEQIPKMIIYGNNVTIACNVSNIDAIIIAEKDLNTCESGDINLRMNSNQLVVNGAIVTDNLYFNRTYGAATGTNSKVPGEIVNYDTSALLWGRAKADPNNEHKNLTSVYIHEIAPRY